MLKGLHWRDRRELRRFALTLSGFLLVVFWLGLPWLREVDRPHWALASAAALAGCGLLLPSAIWPLYAGLRPVLHALGLMNTWALLGAVYFLLITPMGWALRRRNALRYSSGRIPLAASYRTPSATSAREPVEWRRPF